MGWPGGGGGSSSNFSAPWYDNKVSIGCGAKRAVPDLSLNASPNTAQANYRDGKWESDFSTREVVPELAGIFAQII